MSACRNCGVGLARREWRWCVDCCRAALKGAAGVIGAALAAGLLHWWHT